jgi:two-component system, chemotaxis family, protein-glutamate methylesterase/glutaminase
VASEGVALHCRLRPLLLWDKSYAPARHFKIAETAQNQIATFDPLDLVSANPAAARAIVIGASSGGVSALLELVSGLPSDLNAVVGVVLHIGSQHSILPDLLVRRGPLPAVHPQDGQPLAPGTIYVAPPDHHMLFTEDSVRLTRGPRENHARPALDPLFRSAALEWRERAIGVVLTGDLDDGTAGLAAIKACGGTAIVQDPETAFEPSMPASAIANVPVDHCVALTDIAPLLARLAGQEPEPGSGDPPQQIACEQDIFEGKQTMENLAKVGQPSTLTCPECGGGLWELKNTKPLRFRCHTGHGFSARALENAQAGMAEQALWGSVRALEEREILLRRLANVAQATGDIAQAEIGRRQADRVKSQVEALLRLVKGESSSA